MAYRDLQLNEMVSLLSPFVHEEEPKQRFLSIPEIVGLYPRVVATHQQLVLVRPPEEVSDPELKEIYDQQKRKDYRHDRLARCAVLSVEARRERALAEETPDEQTAAACTDALAVLLPDGINIINASYLAEAGNAERLERALTAPEAAPTRALLESIPIAQGETALDVVMAWTQAGMELGRLEAKKTARSAALKQAPAPPLRVLQTARSQWIKLVTLIIDLVEVSDASEDLKAAVTHGFLTAASRAGSRTARRSAPKPDEPSTPAGADTSLPEASLPTDDTAVPA